MAVTPRRALISLTDALTALLTLAHALRLLVGDGTVPGVLLHALLPWWGALAVPALVASAGLQRRVTAALATLATLLYVVALSPPTPPRHGGTVPLRLLSANLFVANRTPAPLIEALIATDADVLALIELDDEWWARLRDDPRLAGWSWRHVAERTDAYGIGVLSRLPLSDARTVEVLGVPELLVTLHTARGPLDLAVVHTTPPYQATWIPQWDRHLRWASAAGTPGRRLLAGDLNASVHHPRFQVLRDAGWRDAGELGGTRLHMTWPSIFPLLGLDHVLIDAPVDVERAAVLEAPGSDHHMLLVTLLL